MSSSTSPSSPSLSAMHIAAVLIALTVGAGTLYSIQNDTFLDTSNPLLAHLPHPSHHLSYFANKKNIFNQLFVKKAWAWTTVAFFAIWATSPVEKRTVRRVGQWVAATAVWAAFTTWFFGPAVFERLTTYSGAECVIHVPNANGHPEALTVPLHYCNQRSILSLDTHPNLFAASLIAPDREFRAVPRLYRGHDISGHIFLLTLATLFLANQLAISWSRPTYVTPAHRGVLVASSALLGLWWWMTLMTAIYFHSPMEKVSGLLVGLAGFFASQIPFALAVPAPPQKIGVRLDTHRSD